MALDKLDLYWVAGLLEGEGCFNVRGRHHAPQIQLAMTDKDIVIDVAKILGCHKVVECMHGTSTGKKLYRTNLYGVRAMGWMMTLYSLMGARRRQKIIECIGAWKSMPRSPYPERKSYSRGATVVWEKANA